MSIKPDPTPGRILEVPHFPSEFQTVIFRLWENVPCKKLAQVLHTTEEKVAEAAENMGLGKQEFLEQWSRRGYISIIRAIWNVLPYEQILEILDYDEDRFNFILQEDDFLRIKLDAKCDCRPVYYRELTNDEIARTREIKSAIEKYIAPLKAQIFEKPFDFFNKERYAPLSNGKIGEIKVDNYWYLEYPQNNELLIAMVENFKAFAKKYGVVFSDTDKGCGKIVMALDAVTDDEEYHEIEVADKLIKINAATAVGILRGICELENRVEASGNFSFDKFSLKKKTKVKTRFIFSFCGLFTDVLDCDTRISFPDELLEGYARCGINGVWIQGIAYRLAPYPFLEGLDTGWEERLKNLADLCNRTAKYGIKVYIYMNEPRPMAYEFYETHPELRGTQHYLIKKTTSLCSSNKDVQEYLRDCMHDICSGAPNLGGFFVITQGENMASCYASGPKSQPPIPCPVCFKRSAVDVTAELITAMASGVASVSDKIKFFAYTWGWAKAFDEELTALLKAIPKNVIILQVSETEMPIVVGGKNRGNLRDYSLSNIGPGEPAKEMWRLARDAGLEVAAKVQVNNSWECSTAPFLPVYNNVVKHIKGLLDEGIEHIMLSWTLGGYMSDNMRIASAYFFEEIESSDKRDPYEKTLEGIYGEYAPTVKEAVKHFCRGFSEFPFAVCNLYRGPSNAGTANLFYPKPTGFAAAMTCYPYDDLEQWRGATNNLDKYTKEEYENQYRLLCEEWEKGLEIIRDMPVCEFKDMAYYGYTLFRSSLNHTRYIMERDGEARKEKLDEIVKNELELTKIALEIVLRNSAVGYEAANHYYFTRSSLYEKLVQCDQLLNSK